MATWIPLESSFPSHPKTKKLRRRYGDVGVLKLVELWLWASEFAPAGLLPDDAEEISVGIDLPDSIPVADFLAALVEIGFLEGSGGPSLRIRNWHERFGRWEAKRQQKRADDAERKRRQRDRLSGVTRDNQPRHAGQERDSENVTHAVTHERGEERREETPVTSRVTKVGHPRPANRYGKPLPDGWTHRNMIRLPDGAERPCSPDEWRTDRGSYGPEPFSFVDPQADGRIDFDLAARARWESWQKNPELWRKSVPKKGHAPAESDPLHSLGELSGTDAATRAHGG